MPVDAWDGHRVNGTGHTCIVAYRIPMTIEKLFINFWALYWRRKEVKNGMKYRIMLILRGLGIGKKRLFRDFLHENALESGVKNGVDGEVVGGDKKYFESWV